MLIPSDSSLRSYLTSITGQLAQWLNAKQVSRLVLAIMDKDSRETIERWQFDITLEDGWGETPDGKENEPMAPEASTSKAKPLPTESEIRAQIQALFKTICSSTAVLPILSESCTFNVLAYTSSDVSVPTTWSDSDPHFVMPKHPTAGVESIKLRSFATGVHQVDGQVSYRHE